MIYGDQLYTQEFDITMVFKVMKKGLSRDELHTLNIQSFTRSHYIKVMFFNGAPFSEIEIPLLYYDQKQEIPNYLQYNYYNNDKWNMDPTRHRPVSYHRIVYRCREVFRHSAGVCG